MTKFLFTARGKSAEGNHFSLTGGISAESVFEATDKVATMIKENYGFMPSKIDVKTSRAKPAKKKEVTP